jgi:hypothetical protein
MTVIADAVPVISDKVLADLPEDKLKLISAMMGNEIFIEFCDLNAKFLWEQAVSLDPLRVNSADDYHDTMKHLRRVSTLWEELKNFAERSKQALAQSEQMEANATRKPN